MADPEFTERAALPPQGMEMVPAESEQFVHPEAVEESWTKKALGITAMGAAAAAVVFLQTPANEAIRADIAFGVLNDTGDGNLAALSVVGSTAVIETAATTTIALGINYKREQFDRAMNWLKRKKTKDVEEIKDANPDINTIGSRLVDLTIMTAVGPGMVIPRRHYQESDRNLGKDMKTGLGYVAVGSGLSGAIGWIIFNGVNHADKVGLRGPAEFVAEHGADWKSYAILGGVYYGGKKMLEGVKAVRNRLSRKPKNEEKAIDNTDQL